MADSALSEVGNNPKTRLQIGDTVANIRINSFRFFFRNYSVKSNVQPFLSDVRRDSGYSFGFSHRFSVGKLTVAGDVNINATGTINLDGGDGNLGGVITNKSIEVNYSTLYTILRNFEVKYSLVESEMEENSRAALHDFNKLVLGNAFFSVSRTTTAFATCCCDLAVRSAALAFS